MEAAAAPEPVVVTSWRHVDGWWPGRLHHLERTVAAAARTWPGVPDWAEKVVAATHEMPAELAEGEWFPRLEVRTTGVTVLLRPAPPRRPASRLWTLPGADPRTAPEVKGPDLAVLADARRTALGRGADDAVLLSSAGHVLEAAHGTLAWWEEEVLTTPPAAGRLPSVTELRLRELAARRGVRTASAHRTPQELAGHELWLLSALHGISGVTAWEHGGRPLVLAAPGRALAWNTALDEVP